MKKGIAILLLAALILTLAGCEDLFSGSRYNVTPHIQAGDQDVDTDLEISGYYQLQQKLVEQVAVGNESVVLYFPGMESVRIQSYLTDAITYLREKDPIGAYALEDVTYDIGTNAGKPAVAVNLSYLHTRSEILRIHRFVSMDDAMKAVYAALNTCEAGVVLRVADFADMDFAQMVQDYVEENPDKCMELPQVSVDVYPREGKDRVLELSFTYQNSREALRQMKQKVLPVFSSAELYLTGDTEVWQKYLHLYSFLMERHQYTVETSITPSYSLLIHGVGDSKAFATVYSGMCRQAGLDCDVVSGTRSGEAWYWNVICQEGVYYYVDLLRCSEQSLFMPRLQEEMTGYVWDYSLYPSQLPQEEVPGENVE